MKVATVVGARPQFVKAAPVSRAFGAAGVDEVLVHTGQHYDGGMSDVFFAELGLPAPRHHLGVGSGSHGVQTARMLRAVEAVLRHERPDWTLVYGDTNSTLAGALASVKLGVPVAHVEAGLRSFDRRMPEELNRIVTDRVARLLFAPTPAAVQNLAREGICGAWVHRVGDVMLDACRMFGPLAERSCDVLERLALDPRRFALVTVHRASNTDDPRTLGVIVAALARLAESLRVVFPVHPRTREAMVRHGLEARLRGPGVALLPPVGYLESTVLQRAAAVVVTDSGGMQKEAFFHGTPCVTLRETTEWPELVELGWNVLVPPHDPATIAGAVLRAAGGPRPSRASTDALYGSGEAARRIAEVLVG